MRQAAFATASQIVRSDDTVSSLPGNTPKGASSGSEKRAAVPLGYDVLAAGIAVAAYGTFFAMPWRMLPIPILIGMLAHALRWVSIVVAGVSAEAGAPARL
jgi:hypothetical protein